jgi:hypothetical protein
LRCGQPLAFRSHKVRSLPGLALEAWETTSRNDNKTSQPLDDGNRNTPSLFFAVGLSGHIARIDPAALDLPK